jgi:TonB-linked SusC/RagA family outer membrane protein
MIKRTYVSGLFFFLLVLSLSAQIKGLKGTVISTDGSPVQGAIMTFSFSPVSSITDKNGNFEIGEAKQKGTLHIVAEGYYEKEYPLEEGRIPEKIVLVPVGEVRYNGLVTFPEYTISRERKSVTTQGAEKKDFKKNFSADLALQDIVPGLMVIGKSGMPGEGAYINLRGQHSFTASNQPLLVVNGVPFLGNEKTSSVISGYSRSMLFGYNPQDIRNVTVLKGADASAYGSLGSNGVILIETEQATSDNLETRISFTGQCGLSIPGRTIPVLGVSNYKTYLQDVGMTRYSQISSLYEDYPFLENSANYYSYLFNNNTDWVREVQGNSLISDNLFRVEGGDEIAKYNIAFGYQSQGGVLGSTRTDRYHTLINANIVVSRDVDIFANVGLYYINSQLQEQSMESSTNALLSSFLAMPMLSPYEKEDDGNILNSYATYNGWNVNSNPTYDYDNVSNPLAIVNTIEATDRIYDANIRFGLNFRINKYLTLNGMTNIYYNYTEETIFIPGVTDQAIIPQFYQTGLNTVRKGVVEDYTSYFGVNALYQRTLNSVHQLKATAGIRYINRSMEYDYASGYNTANDYYQTLNKATDELNIDGDNIEWKWLNANLHVEDTWNELLRATATLAIDGTSVSGTDANRFGLFPSAGLTFMSVNTGLLPDEISLLNLNAEVSRTGNSRFSSNYGKNYYCTSNFFNLGTIVRSNVPNTKLEWEKKDQFDVGADVSLYNNLLNLQLNWFYADSYDLLIDREISSVYGSSQYYDNVGEISTKGLEIDIRFNPIRTKNFDWMIGASLSKAASRVESLGSSTELMTSFESINGDDALIRTKVGDSPYQFYGYRTNGVYATTEDATTLGLKNIYGNDYQAGDVRFVDVYEDGIINEKDKVSLGDAAPDFFGDIHTSFRFRQVSFLAEFGYSVGNKAYNAVRRSLESMDYFYNQSNAVLGRWQIEGQQTDVPRAAYGDPSGNNLFSDRWIEDASYIKLRSLTLSYNFKQDLFQFCRSGSIYITGENLFTWTNYLGSNPEFSYSNSECMQGFDYAKISLPKNIKIGFSLNF